MTQDPYAAPQANIESAPSGTGLVGGTGTFDLGRTLNDGWTNTISNLGPMIGVMIVGMLVMSVFYVTIIGIFLGVPIVFYGMTKFLLNAHDGRAEFGDLFSGFSNYGAILGRMLVFGILWVLIYVAGASVQ